MAEEFRIWADNFHVKPFTVNGKEIELVAVQKSMRAKRAGRTNYVYHILDTNTIMINFSINHPYWMKIAPDSEMDFYYQAFMNRPVKDKTKEWLQRNNYELI